MAEPLTITTATGGDVNNLISIANDRARKALEQGDVRAARRAFASIRKYAVQAERATSGVMR